MPQSSGEENVIVHEDDAVNCVVRQISTSVDNELVLFVCVTPLPVKEESVRGRFS